MDFCTIDNGQFIAYPTNKVLGILNDSGAVRALYDALTGAGMESDRIEVLCGAAAASQLDVEGDQHGPLSRLTRLVQNVADGEGQTLKRHREELEAGRFLVSAPAGTREIAHQIGDLFKAHGGHYIHYYTPLAVEALDA